MTQQGRPRGPHSGQQDDWWSQLYDPGSPDTGRSRAGDTLDDRYASVRRTMGPATAPPPQPVPPEAPRVPEPERRGESGAAEPPDPGPANGGETGARTERQTGPVTERQPREPEQTVESDGAPKPDGAVESDGAVEPDGAAVADAGPASAEDVPLRPAHVGERPPTYEAEPATFPSADPAALSELVPDTVLDGAHYGGLTLRATSLRGDSARHRGALRRDALLTARFGSGESALLLVAVAGGGRAATGGHRAAREVCHSIGAVVGRSHARLAEDIRADRRSALKPGLQRLTERCYGKLRAQAAALGVQPEEYTADLRCLLLSADPRCRTRVFFGSGDAGLFRLRSGAWRDLEAGPDGHARHPGEPFADDAGEGPATTSAGLLDPSELADLAALSVPSSRRVPVPPPAPRQDPDSFRFCATAAQRGDVLLLCSPGLAAPLRGEPAFARRLARSWTEKPEPPGLAAFLADVQLRVRGYADDRTAVAVWEG
ncbi:protein phosphatase 2C domain-containing protein [Streptomyces ovatisporus]|uniref:Protein phosphatase 2C domain-containing protein n=1 Tax=Streptomyces ovatisporus TaxID=1128682 RepID=A0ABV9ADE0_9ACTN